MANTEARWGADLGDVLEEQRSGLLVHCYRLLGSFHDAEEATQETFLRAWRGRGGYRGEASVKTWLYRIATRVCIDQLRRRSSRVTPMSLSVASDPGSAPAAPVELDWLEPIATAHVVGTSLDPEAAYTLAESVKIAFVAALQSLSPRQRAVLILRDVLAWSAAETADVLDMSVAATDSALHRARLQLRETYHPSGIESFPGTEPDDPTIVRTLAAYLRAWQRDDIEGLVETLREDVRVTMPPIPSWYSGREDVVAFLRRWVMPQGRLRLSKAFLNAQPAYVMWRRGLDGHEQAFGVQVLTMDVDGIAAIDCFAMPGVMDGLLLSDQGRA